VHLTVIGPPRLDLDPGTRFETSAGSDTTMEVKVCGEPMPVVQWQFDHVVLQAGAVHGRYNAHMLEKIASYHNCYKSRLTVMAADTGDSKTYQVHVQNDHGAETHSLELRVHETSQIEVLIAIAVGGVLTILTICLIIIYVLVSRDSWSWCWCLRLKHSQSHAHNIRQGSDISELASDKTDIESPDSSIITSSAANNIYYHDLRAENSFHTFNRQKKQSVIPCGAYSVTQGSISSISPHRTERSYNNDCQRLGIGIDRNPMANMTTMARLEGVGTINLGGVNVRNSRTNNCLPDPPPDLSGISYYRYN